MISDSNFQWFHTLYGRDLWQTISCIATADAPLQSSPFREAPVAMGHEYQPMIAKQIFHLQGSLPDVSGVTDPP
jgi:hypothetical protein